MCHQESHDVRRFGTIRRADFRLPWRVAPSSRRRWCAQVVRCFWCGRRGARVHEGAVRLSERRLVTPTWEAILGCTAARRSARWAASSTRRKMHPCTRAHLAWGSHAVAVALRWYAHPLCSPRCVCTACDSVVFWRDGCPARAHNNSDRRHRARVNGLIH